MRSLRFALALAAVALISAAPAFAAGGPSGSADPVTIGGRPAQKTPFPDIKDMSSLHIVLQRSVCLGTCPDYSVDIAGDGTVVYTGRRFVAIGGRHVTHIAPQAVAKLVDAFREAEFFWLLDSYTAGIPDLPTHCLSIAFDGHSKSVTDLAGVAVGMPEAVQALEAMVDDAAGTKAWIDVDAHSFERLQAEGWDFHAKSDANRGLLSAAASSGSASFVRQLLAAGVPADGPEGCDALSDAAKAANQEMVEALLAAGAPDSTGRSAADPRMPCSALVSAAQRAVPAVLAAILKARPDSVHRTFDDGTALFWLAEDDMGAFAHPDQDIPRCAEMLIAAGIDVNAPGYDGHTALDKARNDAALVRVLLKAGANGINSTNGSDWTPLMASMNADVTRTLLEAGANPYLKDREGKTALDIAVEHHDDKIAAVLRVWMASHPPR